MSLQTRPREDLVKMLDENHHLILQIADLQNKGRAGDCHIVQKHLLKNLLYLGTLANEQIKKEELQLSPSTRSNLRAQSTVPRVANLPIGSLDVNKYLRPEEALPSAAQHKARAVTCTPQETPVVVSIARPRRLQTMLVDSTPRPAVPLVRVELPQGTTVPGQRITTNTAGAISLQRPVPLSKSQSMPVQVVQSQRWSNEIGAISPGETVRVQTIPSPSNSIIVAPNGQILQLQNPMSTNGSTRLNGPIVIPVASSAATQEQGPTEPNSSLQTGAAVPAQKYVATMTPQGMVLVPMKSSPQD